MTTTFSYAVQIQPRTGQRLVEHRGGLTIDVLEWTSHDRARHPQADRQVADGFVLVVDRATRLLYEVAREEVRG